MSDVLKRIDVPEPTPDAVPTGSVLLAMLVIVRSVDAQLPGTQVPGGCDVPVSQRSSGSVAVGDVIGLEVLDL